MESPHVSVSAKIKTQDVAFRTVRESLSTRGFHEIAPPLLESSIDPPVVPHYTTTVPGDGSLGQVSQTSRALLARAAAEVGAVFAFQQICRPGETASPHHLRQFTQLQIQLPGPLEAAVSLAHELTQALAEAFERDGLVGDSSVPKTALSQPDAVSPHPGHDLDWKASIQQLAAHPGEIVRLTGRPVAMVPDLVEYKRDGDRLVFFELIAPLATEFACGGELEMDAERFLAQAGASPWAAAVRDAGAPSPFEPVAELLRGVSGPQSTLVIGVERMMQFASGRPSIVDVIPFALPTLSARSLHKMPTRGD